MASVIITPSAAEEWEALDVVPHGRVAKVIDRLNDWPEVSGAKPLSGNLAGHYRIRTGDYRVQFTATGEVVTVEKIGHRDGFYDERR